MDPVTAILFGFGVTNLNLTLMSMAASEKKDAENQNDQNNYPNNDYRNFNEAISNGYTSFFSRIGED